MEYEKCPICGSPCRIKYNDHYNQNYISCLRCSDYHVTRTIKNMLEGGAFSLSEIQVAIISGWIRENQGSDVVLNREKIKLLKTLKTPTVFEKANLILKYLGNQYPVAGTAFNYDFSSISQVLNNNDVELFNENKVNKKAKKLLPLISIGRIINKDEFIYVIETYLRNENGYLSNSLHKITPAGWSYLESLRQPNPESKKAFVAMWFTDEMNEICENYIKKAAEKAGGYKATPINEKDYNGDINDEIIGEIRNSKFVIADFTGNRGGVYYEAGFAYGLNIPVIYTCREAWFNQFVKQSIKIKDPKGKEDDNELNIFSQIHFDINHHNFIIWKDGDDLYEQLVKRIKATIT